MRLTLLSVIIPPLIINLMLTDKKSVALITGAASNIGLAIANRFIGDFHVVGVDRSFGSESIENQISSINLIVLPAILQMRNK